jgi:hypothetical protein
MQITRDYKETINERVQSDSDFAIALLDEAVTLFLNGEPDTARLILRDLINASLGFQTLAKETAKPSKSLGILQKGRKVVNTFFVPQNSGAPILCDFTDNFSHLS